MNMNSQIYALLLGWLAYFALHSMLASLGVKQWVAEHRPSWMRAYRLLFNGIALLALMPILYLWHAASGPLIWERPEALRWLFDGIAVAALLGFLHSTRYYDMAEFFGARQWLGKVTAVEDQEHLQLSPYHRFVRHPWYFFALVLIWSRDMDMAWLLSSGFITAYFVIGSRLEERKLRAYYGAAYNQYCQQVPGLLPLPGKSLSAEDAQNIEQQATPSDQAC